MKVFKNDPTVTRERKLQRYLLSPKKKNAFTREEYKFIYRVGSNIARIYGFPKLHKLTEDMQVTDILKKLKLILTISSIGTYNYKLF